MASDEWKDIRANLAPQILQKTGGRCAYCGRKLHTSCFGDVSFDVEHVVPQSKGGPHSLLNLVPACRRCNLQKNTQSLDEYKHYIPQSIIHDLESALTRMQHHRNVTDFGLLTQQIAIITNVIEALTGMPVEFAFENLLYEAEETYDGRESRRST